MSSLFFLLSSPLGERFHLLGSADFHLHKHLTMFTNHFSVPLTHCFYRELAWTALIHHEKQVAAYHKGCKMWASLPQNKKCTLLLCRGMCCTALRVSDDYYSRKKGPVLPQPLLPCFPPAGHSSRVQGSQACSGAPIGGSCMQPALGPTQERPSRQRHDSCASFPLGGATAPSDSRVTKSCDNRWHL